MGPAAHARYFDLKKFSPEQRKSYLKQERGAYTAYDLFFLLLFTLSDRHIAHRFGTASSLLSLIPFASIPIQFTNTVGAALWAADIEHAGDSLINSKSD